MREFVEQIVLYLIRIDHRCHFARINSNDSFNCCCSICDSVADDATDNIPRNEDESKNQKQQNETEIILKKHVGVDATAKTDYEPHDENVK